MPKREPLEDTIEDLKREIYFMFARRFGEKAEDIFTEAIWAGTREAIKDFKNLQGKDLLILIKLREASLHQQALLEALSDVHRLLSSVENENEIFEEGKGNA